MTATAPRRHAPSPTARRVCIVTPSYISSTPRAVREADALAAAGYDVRVVFTQGALHEVRAFDHDVLDQSAWRASAVRWSKQVPDERWTHWRSGVRHRLVQALPARAASWPGVAERAEGRVFPELAKAVDREPADLYIGHYPVGLAAAAIAARRHAAHVSYDIEDLYSEIWPGDGVEWARARARVIEIERRYVRACTYLSAVSQPAADWFAERFQTPAPVVIHNCHPWTDRQTLDGLVQDRQGEALSLYWYSQTVGLDRGLQEVIQAAGLAAAPVQIHLRGALSEDTGRALRAVAERAGLVSCLHFHELVTPARLLSRAAEHDVGLAVEVPASINRSLAVTNKIFLYLTAGLAVAASDLPGQRGVMAAAPGAGAVYGSGDIRTLAAHLRRWSLHPGELAEAKRQALRAAHDHWNLEQEMERLVATVDALWRGSAGRVA